MAYNLKKDPKRLAFVLARYSFAAQMTADCGSILELGCSEGVGASMLHGGTKPYLGMDLDTPAIEAAQNNFATDKVRFKNENFLHMDEDKFEAVVSLDVVEHISKGADEDAFLKRYMTTLPQMESASSAPRTLPAPHTHPRKVCAVMLICSMPCV